MNSEFVQEIIFESMAFVLQLHIYHLTTRSYSGHKGLNEAYDDIQKDTDSLTESFIGMGYDLESFGDYSADFVTEFDYEEVLEYLEGYREKITNAIEMTSEPDFMALQNVLVDIQGDIDGLKYQLTKFI